MRHSMTPYAVGQRLIGEVREIPGADAHPLIMAMLLVDGNDWTKERGDETPWCSAYVNWCAWMGRCVRSKSLMARSWLTVGHQVAGAGSVGHGGVGAIARAGDVVILQRGGGDQPGPSELNAPGHVGFFAGYVAATVGSNSAEVQILGGNQGNTVSVRHFPLSRVLGVRRIVEDPCS